MFNVGDKVEVTHRTDGARFGFKPGEYKAATVAEVCTYGGYFVTFEEGGPRVGVYGEDETREAIHTFDPNCPCITCAMGRKMNAATVADCGHVGCEPFHCENDQVDMLELEHYEALRAAGVEL